MSLPDFIPLQSVPFAHQGDDGQMYVEINWYLFLYNLWINVLGAAGTPLPPALQISMTDADADGADIVQAYRGIANAELMASQTEDSISIDLQILRRLLNAISARDALNDEIVGTDVAGLPLRDNNVQLLQNDPEVGPTFLDVSNARTLAYIEDPIAPSPGSWQPFTPTISAGSGSFTTVAAAGRYQVTGKTVFIAIEVDVTNAGTAASSVNALLPIASSTSLPIGYQIIGGREVAQTGKTLTATIVGTALATVFYDNSFPGATGNKLIIQGCYEAA